MGPSNLMDQDRVLEFALTDGSLYGRRNYSWSSALFRDETLWGVDLRSPIFASTDTSSGQHHQLALQLTKRVRGRVSTVGHAFSSPAGGLHWTSGLFAGTTGHEADTHNRQAHTTGHEANHEEDKLRSSSVISRAASSASGMCNGRIGTY